MLTKKQTFITFCTVLIFFSIPLTVVAAFWVRSYSGEAKSAVPQVTYFGNQSSTESEFVSNEILIKLKENPSTKIKSKPAPADTGLKSINQLNKKNKVSSFATVFADKKTKNTLPERWVKITTKDKKEILKGTVADLAQGSKKLAKIGKLLSEYKNDPNVETVAPSVLVKQTTLFPNDYHFTATDIWGDIYHKDLWNLRKIKLPIAWNQTTGSKDVVVAVVDSGIDYNHPDLSPNIWQNSGEIANNGVDDDGNGYIDDTKGWNFANNNNDTMDYNGHGTHVAGIIGAVGNNDPDHSDDSGTRIVGVNWAVSLMPVKFMSATSGPDYAAAAAIRYATDNGADIINASWGGYFPSEIISDEINYAHSKGVIIVVSSGNNSGSALQFHPANEPNVITVAATNYLDQKSCFSNWGVAIDVAAPGGDGTYCGGANDGILSAKSSRSNLAGIGDHYLLASGTSMAAPHVTGLAALIKAKQPGFNNEEIRHILRNSAEKIMGSGWNDNIGYGRIRADSALSITSPPPTPRITTSSTSAANEVVPIKGWVRASNPLTSYKLEYGGGKNPSNWTLLASGSSAIPNEIELARLDGRNLSGYYTIRLSATDSDGQTSEDRIQIYFETNFVSGWPKIVAKPSIFLMNYFLAGEESSLAFGDITGDGTPELVASSGCTILAWKGSGTLVPGFPKEISDDSCEAIRNVSLVDLDGSSGNGAREILVTGGSKFVYVLNGDGDIRSGWPRNLAEIDPRASNSGLMGLFPYSSGIATDIDQDGIPEIIVYGFSIASQRGSDPVFAFEGDGSLIPGWPVVDPRAIGAGFLGSGSHGNYLPGQENETLISSVFDSSFFTDSGKASLLRMYIDGGSAQPYQYSFTTANLDDDSLDEIVGVFYASGKRYVEVLNLEGSTNTIWRKEVNSSLSAPSVADLDGDGEPEILFNANDKIYVWNKDGSDFPGWPKDKARVGRNQYNPIAADTNADGNLEIIIADASGDGLNIYDLSGNKIFSAPHLSAILSNPVVADFDGDRSLEIALLANSELDPLDSSSANILILKIPGTEILPSATPWPQLYQNMRRTSFYQSCGGDLNKDGSVDPIDINLIIQSFGKQNGQTGFYSEYDMDSDGFISITDIARVVSAAGDCRDKEPDSDKDSFSNREETYLGTDKNASCPNNVGHSAWPPDFDNNKVVTVSEIFQVVNKFGKKAGDPEYSPRIDLNTDLIIDVSDINIVIGNFGKSCET